MYTTTSGPLNVPEILPRVKLFAGIPNDFSIPRSSMIGNDISPKVTAVDQSIQLSSSNILSLYQIKFVNDVIESDNILKAYFYGGHGIVLFLNTNSEKMVAGVVCDFGNPFPEEVNTLTCKVDFPENWVKIQNNLYPQVYQSKNRRHQGIIFFDVIAQATLVHMVSPDFRPLISTSLTQEPYLETLSYIHVITSADYSSNDEISTDLYLEFLHFDGTINVYIAEDFDLE